MFLVELCVLVVAYGVLTIVCRMCVTFGSWTDSLVVISATALLTSFIFYAFFASERRENFHFLESAFALLLLWIGTGCYHVVRAVRGRQKTQIS